ncbi:hypothetical protein HY623_03450 [Candidatus Uhrbacteria bacterium]|nr:hypothetical protein [Candidatus Uhrbacteria bacterium]
MKSAEDSICQNCKQSFIIEPEDFAFYEKMNVPPPTWCPECRLIRRLAFDNLRTIYSGGRCVKCEKGIITSLPPNTERTVYCNTCWWGDSWDGFEYGRDVDFDKPFLQQVKELMAVVPQMARANDEPTLVNSDYTMNVGHLKNCYLVFHADFDEDCAYCDTIDGVKDSLDCSRLSGCELCYECVNLKTCYKAVTCVDCENSNDIMFCRDCIGCTNCFGCVGLRNKEYCYFNEQLTREEYEKRMAEFRHGSYTAMEEMRGRAREFWETMPRRYMHGKNNEDVSGDYIDRSKNTHHSFQVSQCEDSKFIAIVGIQPTKDSYDYYSWGSGVSRIYECAAVGENADRVKFTFMSWPSCSEVEYSMYAVSSSNCFGCVGIRNKNYCILNKQYTKEEYEMLVQKIKHHMNDMPYIDAVGREYRYGEFFPTELSAFAYNESRVQEYFPLTKEEALEKGYAWRDRVGGTVLPTIHCTGLPDDIHDVPDTITKEIIECTHIEQCNHECKLVFKVIAQELAFYKKMNIPLPRLCFNCRYAERIKLRNPMKLWLGQCQCGGEKSQSGVYKNTAQHTHGASPCAVTFQTSYAPDRPDIVYCAECYQQEVL